MNHCHRHEKLRISVKVPSIELMNQLHARALPWTWLVLMEMLGWTGFIYFAKALLHTHGRGFFTPRYWWQSTWSYMEPHLKQCNIWDEIVCFVCFVSQLENSGTSIPAQGSWTTFAAEFVLGPKRRGKKLMNIFLGQDIGHLRQANLKMWSDQSLAELFCSLKTSQPDPNPSTKMIFPKIIITESQKFPHPLPSPILLLPSKGTPLHSMARWASRLDDLSHVLAWGRCVLAPFWGVKDHGNADQKSGCKGWVSDP